MKIFLCLLSLLCLESQALSADQLSVNADFTVENEFEELDLEQAEKDGWMVSESEPPVYSLKISIAYSDLPIKKSLGPAYFSIAKDGLVKIGISLGDADAGSETELQMPQKNNSMLKLSSPISVKNSGGDYASGSWAFDGKLTLSPEK